MGVIVEVCIASVEDAIVAQQGGADRVELNAGLQLGGLTPSIGLFQEVRSAISLPIIAMLRPRPGDFAYSESEFQVMLRDAAALSEHGADGLAFGFLDRNYQVDVVRTREVRHCVGDGEAVFHRAFDFCEDLLTSTTCLIDCGIDRILTSGGKATALAGIEQIRRVVEHSGNRIEILPAAGIGPENGLEIVRRTGCRQLHGSFSTTNTPPADPGAKEWSLANPDFERCSRTDIGKLESLVRILNKA